MQPLIYICGNCNKRFSIERGKRFIYYMCPNHRMENRSIDDDMCNNFVSRNAINTIRMEIENLYESGLLEKGYKDYILIRRWSVDKPVNHKDNQPVKVYYKVEEIDEDYILISIKNERVIKNEDDV